MTAWQKGYSLATLIATALAVVLGVALGRNPDEPAVLVLFSAGVSLSGWFGGARRGLFVSWLLSAAVSLGTVGCNSAGAPVGDGVGRAAAFVGVGALIALAVGVAYRRRNGANDGVPEPVTEPQTVAVLVAGERHFQRLAAAIPQIMWSASADGTPDYCNRGYYDALGLTAATVLTPEGIARAVHPDDAERYRSAWVAALRLGAPGAAECRLRALSGDQYRWHECRFLPVCNSAGHVERWFCTCTDIEEQKQAEVERRALLDRLEVAVQERTGELLRANAALSEEIHRREQAEAVRTGLLRRIATAQEDERSRIARELHDQMGQYLAAVGIGLRVVGEAVPTDGLAAGRLAHLRQLTEEVGREMHRLAVELRPAALDDLGLRAAIQNYVEEWARRSGVEIDYHASGSEEPLPRPVEIVVYRVVQEALTNVLKHAQARRVGVVVRRATQHLHLMVEDDGRGFEAARAPSPAGGGGRLGLLGMAERVAQVGGHLEIDSEPGRGAAVVVRIPIGVGTGGRCGE